MEQISSLFVQYLSSILGTLFEGDFSEKNLHLEISSGSFRLENVRFKKQLFSDLPVGIILCHGSIGKLELSVPWNNLGNAPLCMSLDNVFLLMKPSFCRDTKTSAARKAYKRKLSKISAVESFYKLRGHAHSHGSISNFLLKYFGKKLAKMIIDTLEVSIRNVHVRFEDQVSCSDMAGGICLGATLESLYLHPVCRSDAVQFMKNANNCHHNNKFQTTFQSADTLQLRCDVDSLAIYCNELNIFSECSSCIPLVGKASDEVVNVLYSTIPRGYGLNIAGSAHILQPHHFSLNLGLNLSHSSGSVYLMIELMAKRLTLEVEDAQLKNIATLSRFIEKFLKVNELAKYRPDGSGMRRKRVTDPTAWWKYAIDAVRCQLGHYSRPRLTSSVVNRYFKDKLVYTGV